MRLGARLRSLCVICLLINIGPFTQPAYADCASDSRELVKYCRQLLPLQAEQDEFDSASILEADGDPLISAQTVSLSPHGARMTDVPSGASTPADHFAATKEALITLRHNHELLHPTEPFPGMLRLSIAPETRWSDIVSVFNVLGVAKYDRVQLVTWRHRSPPIPVPPPSSADKELVGFRSMSADAQATLLAKLLGKDNVTCPSLMLLFAGLAGVSPELKSTLFVDGLQEALEKCHCRADLPSLRTTIFRLLTPSDLEHQYVQTTVRYTEEKRAPIVSRPANSSWRTVAKGVLEALRKQSGPVRLAAE